MTYYKVLGDNGAAFYGGSGCWPLPSGKRPGKWLKVDGGIVACRRGLHFCRGDQLLGWLGPHIWEIEVRGDIVDAGDKLVCGEARLVRKYDGWNERTALLFAVDCATRALNREKRAGRTPDKRSYEALKVARRFANGEATSDELAAAWDAARDAARDVASAAAWDAARAAARAAARDAAWAAARDAAWDAASAAASAAAWDAARAAAWAAARDAAWDAASAAAWDAASAAAWDAARAAAWDAASAAASAAAWAAARAAAWDAARDAETRWQKKRLLEYVEGKR